MMADHVSNWVSYLVSMMYGTILIGCLIGIRLNFEKKKALLVTNEYQKQQRVFRWRFRFYLTLFSAILIRIVTIISAVILQKTMVLSKATNQQQFIWSSIASIASMLFFTAFTFIIWFFASLTFHRSTNIKRLITPFFTAINVALYISALSIAISSYAASQWDLLYDYELPLFAICGWLLSICFVFLSWKISTNIERERQDTVEYMEHSRILSVTQSQKNRNYSNNEALIGGQNTLDDKVDYDGNGQANTTSIPTVDMNTNNSKSSYVINRLIKLSLLCALCWIARGTYLISLRIWTSTDKTPFNIPELTWEALFYFVTEYPPALGALILMISKPKMSRGNINLHTQDYPQAKQQEY